VPGPKTGAEMRATLRYLELTDEEKDHRPVVGNLHDVLAGQCVYCHHCLPCPQGIEVGWVIWMLDHAQGGVTDDLMGWYSSLEAKASDCIECGDCVERCPFDVDVYAKLGQAAVLFEASAG